MFDFILVHCILYQDVEKVICEYLLTKSVGIFKADFLFSWADACSDDEDTPLSPFKAPGSHLPARPPETKPITESCSKDKMDCKNSADERLRKPLELLQSLFDCRDGLFNVDPAVRRETLLEKVLPPTRLPLFREHSYAAVAEVKGRFESAVAILSCHAACSPSPYPEQTASHWAALVHHSRLAW